MMGTLNLVRGFLIPKWIDEDVKIDTVNTPFRYFLTDANSVFSRLPDASVQLKIVYSGEQQEYDYNQRAYRYALPQTSYLKFRRDQLVIHDNGYYENPLSFYMEGYLAWSEKIAELMPLEYQLDEK